MISIYINNKQQHMKGAIMNANDNVDYLKMVSEIAYLEEQYNFYLNRVSGILEAELLRGIRDSIEKMKENADAFKNLIENAHHS